MGFDVFKTEIEKYLGFQFQPARPYTFNRNANDFGWHTGEDGKHHFTYSTPSRMDACRTNLDATTLQEIAKIHKGSSV